MPVFKSNKSNAELFALACARLREAAIDAGEQMKKFFAAAKAEWPDK